MLITTSLLPHVVSRLWWEVISSKCLLPATQEITHSLDNIWVIFLVHSIIAFCLLPTAYCLRRKINVVLAAPRPNIPTAFALCAKTY